MSTTGSSNPEYVNARVRARRATLFGDEEYRKLVRMGPGGIARFMEDSEYEAEINALGARHRGVDLIEYALNRNLAKHFEDLLSWAEGSLYELIARYLRKYDAWNVKTAIRGVYTESTAAEIESDYIRAGELDERTLEAMAACESVDDVIETLTGTVYYEPLVAAREEFENTHVLVPLENAVDRTFYERLIGGIDTTRNQGPMALYAEFLQAEIDFLNVRNTLRLARSGADIDPAEYFIEGGRLFDRGQLRALVGDRDALVSHIAESTYGDELGDALARLEEADSMIAFEHAIDEALLAYADRLANAYPVSVTSVLAYVLAKEREVENIRAIARGREAGLDEDEIERELVIR